MDPNPAFENGTMSRASTSQDQSSITQSMAALGRDLTVMIEREMNLLRTELSEKATLVKTSGASLVSAIALIVLGVQGLVAAAVIGLAMVMDWWLAALIVGAVLVGIGAMLAMKAKKSLSFDNLIPKKSADALGQIGSKIKETANESYH